MNNQIIQLSNVSFANRKFNSGDDYTVYISLNKPIKLMFSASGSAIISIRHANHFGLVVNTTSINHAPNSLTTYVIPATAPFCYLIISFTSTCVASLDVIEGGLEELYSTSSMPDELNQELNAIDKSFIINAVAINLPSSGLPRDLWDYSAVANYPLLGSVTPQAMQVASISAADTGILRIKGYQNLSQTTPVVGSVNLLGTTNVNIGSWLHIISMEYLSTSGNVGAINVTLISSPSTVVAHMRAGVGMTYNGLIYIPQGKTLYVKNITTISRGSSSANASGYFRSVINGNFSLQLPFSHRSGAVNSTDYDYKLSISGRASLIPSVFFNSVVNAELQIILTGFII